MPRDIPYIPSHEDVALGEELPSRWRGATRLRALVSAFCAAVQLIEDEAYDLVVSLDLDTATGLHLDVRGGRVFEPRRGLSDEEYRAIIRAKIRALRACGTAQDVYDVARLVAPPDTEVRLRELPLASYDVIFVVDPSREPSALYRRRMRALMDLVRPLGWNPEYVLVTTRPAFAFDGPPTSAIAGYDVGHFADLL